LGDAWIGAAWCNRGLVDVLSPELVLVSPPEIAAEARLLVPDPIRGSYVPRVTLTRRAIALFYACCVAGTIGPLLLAYAAR
jgi:hypothetical protein